MPEDDGRMIYRSGNVWQVLLLHSINRVCAIAKVKVKVDRVFESSFSDPDARILYTV